MKVTPVDGIDVSGGRTDWNIKHVAVARIQLV